MRDRILIFTLYILLLSGLFIGNGILSPDLFADLLLVPSEYDTIPDAIDAAKAGDTIQIAEGTYDGRIEMKPSITIVGAGQDYTTIDGLHNEHCIVMDDNCTIRELRIMNGDVGVWADNINDGKIENCYIESRYMGLFANNSKIVVKNNHFFCTYTALHVQNSDNFSIENNRIEGRYVGIWCEDSTNVQIMRNAVTGFLVNVMIYGCKPLVANNFIITPLLAGISCADGADATILNNTISGSLWYGLCTMNSSPVVANNIIAYNAYGFDSEDGSIPYTTHNIFSPNCEEDYMGLAPSETDIENDAGLVGGGFSSEVSEYILVDESKNWKPGSLEGRKLVSNVLGQKYEYNGPEREYWIVANTETSITIFEDYNYNPLGMLTSNFTEAGDPYFIYTTGLQTNSPAINAGYPDSFLNDLDGSRNDIGVTGGPFSGWVGNTRPPRLKAMIPQEVYTEGEHLHLVVHIENINETPKTVDLYKILKTSSGDLYFKSDGSYSNNPTYERRTLTEFYRKVDTIFDLILPSPLPGEDYEFTAKMTETGTDELVWEESTVNFSLYNLPQAKFTVTPTTGQRLVTIFKVDASESTDVEDATPVLQVRWNWGDGPNYTNWTNNKKAQHKYPSSGTKVITLQVKDLDGNIGSTTQSITVTE